MLSPSMSRTRPSSSSGIVFLTNSCVPFELGLWQGCPEAFHVLFDSKGGHAWGTATRRDESFIAVSASKKPLCKNSHLNSTILLRNKFSFFDPTQHYLQKKSLYSRTRSHVSMARSTGNSPVWHAQSSSCSCPAHGEAGVHELLNFDEDLPEGGILQVSCQDQRRMHSLHAVSFTW